MTQEHLIDTVTMEIGLKRPGEAFGYQNQCSDLLREDLASLIADICDAHSSPGEHITIDRLEIDLGRVTAASFRSDMVEKFGAEFTRKLLELLEDGSAEIDYFQESMPHSRSLDSFGSRESTSEGHSRDWETVKHFLMYGTLPWFADASSFTGFEEALVSAVADDLRNRAELRSLLKTPRYLARFLMQANDETLTLTYSRLFGTDLDWAELFAAVESAISGRISVGAPISHLQLWQGVWDQALEQADPVLVLTSVWEKLLDHLPHPKASIINGLSQDQALIVSGAGISPDLFLESLDAVRLRQSALDAEIRETPYDLEAEMRMIEDDAAPEISETAGSGLVEEGEAELRSDSLHTAPRATSLTPDPEFDPQEFRASTDVEGSGADGETGPVEATDAPIDASSRAEYSDAEDSISSAPAGSGSQAGVARVATGGSEKNQPGPGHDRGRLATEERAAPPGDEGSLEKRLADFRARMHSPGSSQHEIGADAGEDETLESAEMVGRSQRSRGAEPEVVTKTETEPESVDESALTLDRFQVGNAGLVIFWPYLQIFFQELGLLRDGNFKNPAAREKAIHLLQFIACGEENTEEHALTLNKILCNWDLHEPLKRFIPLTKKDKRESMGLINSVIDNWPILGNTSPENLQRTFVLRKGILQHQSNGWLLRIEKGPYDILVDKIPWNLSMIQLSWMDQLLRVEW